MGRGYLPRALQNQWQELWQQFGEVAPESLSRRIEADTEILCCVQVLFLGSRYAFELCRSRPENLLQLLDSDEGPGPESMRGTLAQRLAQVDDDAELLRELRLFRQQQMLSIIWRDLNRLATMEATVATVSELAKACLDAVDQYYYAELCQRFGVPMSRDGQRVQRMVILGMGKLGADELNLSSDVDLIFCYPEYGDTHGGERSIDNQDFFTRLGRKIIRAIDTVTADGFVFRVDMRLRPYGQAGALALNFDAMVEYYQDQGREWERYAMIKAWPVAGDIASGVRLMTLLRPFCFRRYIDFSVIDALRQLKVLIQQEVARKGMSANIKLGAGGIREIEFIVQSFQLVRGGRERALQQRHLLPVLASLGAQGLLPEEGVDQLRDAYIFLRNTEHALQAWADQQTQELPDDADRRARLAMVMGFADWEAYEVCLLGHRDNVSSHFGKIIDDRRSQDEPEANKRWFGLWMSVMSAEEQLLILKEENFQQAEEVMRLIDLFRSSKPLLAMESIGRKRFDQFIPRFLAACAASPDPDLSLIRVMPLLEAVQRRTAYIVLLDENPQALKELLVLCAASPMIAQQMARFPALLDELLDAHNLYKPPGHVELVDQLRQATLRLHWDDLEAHMEALRYFRMAHVLRVAAAEITGRLPLMQVSDYLTDIAEVVLEHVWSFAWEELVSKYGRPTDADGELADDSFIIVAYGKLGGIELGYGSDLDLVFLYDAPATGATDGDRSIDNSVFFTRLGQRIIHFLTTKTALGDLYEVDMRLRPSGSSGLLVSSIDSYAKYQREQAWTWEHQALVRARPVAGSAGLKQRFQDLRRSILALPRDTQKLREDVVAMRNKMRDHLTPVEARGEGAQQFHLKHSPGAIVDIEFVVQYAVLAWASQNAALSEFSDNIRILESLATSSLISEAEAQVLIDAYRDYRSASHRLALQSMQGLVPIGEYTDQRRQVESLWHKFFSEQEGLIE